MGHTSGIGVLDKAIALLDVVAVSPASLTDLMAGTGLPRATAHRLATALETHRILSRDAAGRFVLGNRLEELAGARPDPLPALAAPVLTALRDSCGESVQLYRRDGSERVCIATAERASGLRTTVPLGSRLPMTGGSGAHVLAAWADPTTRAALTEGAKFSDRTLAEVRRRGWAQSVGERELGVASVSAPVFDRSHDVVAAISISGPVDRVGRTPGRSFAAQIVAAAAELSAALQ